jgi:plasmid stabilization system protein ParE
MANRLFITPRAIRDVEEARQWYDERRPGLGEELLQSVNQCVESIRSNPEAFAIAHKSYRRALVRRFPYAVFYEFAAGTVTVYSVFHCSRDPETILDRLP